jgi:hypothetical protein
VLAAKRVNSPLRFTHPAGAMDPGQACHDPLSNTTVYEQAHTVVFAAAGVSDAAQQEVAEYAEAAALELRRTFQVTATEGLGTANQKTQVCVQPELFRLNGITAVGVAITYRTLNAVDGFSVMQSPTAYFENKPRSNLADLEHTRQAHYSRILVHELTHLVEFARVTMRLDQWVTEGMAKYMEFGRPAFPKTQVLDMFATQNPISIAWTNTDARPGLSGYEAAATVMAYLLSPTGAKNSVATYVALIDKLKADTATYYNACAGNGFTAPSCSGADLEAQRSAAFVSAFEATFKERDGTPMKLRSGPNNLQDTIVARITAWW